MKEYNAQYYEKRKALHKEVNRRRREQYPNEFKNWDKKKRYGISYEEYQKFLLQQGSTCAICKVLLVEGAKSANLDHDHSTGKLRGFLCFHCNRGLGSFFDRPELLRKAVEYLITTKEEPFWSSQEVSLTTEQQQSLSTPEPEKARNPSTEPTGLESVGGGSLPNGIGVDSDTTDSVAVGRT